MGKGASEIAVRVPARQVGWGAPRRRDRSPGAGRATRPSTCSCRKQGECGLWTSLTTSSNDIFYCAKSADMGWHLLRTNIASSMRFHHPSAHLFFCTEVAFFCVPSDNCAPVATPQSP